MYVFITKGLFLLCCQRVKVCLIIQLVFNLTYFVNILIIIYTLSLTFISSKVRIEGPGIDAIKFKAPT